jgi:hypothetical protein
VFTKIHSWVGVALVLAACSKDSGSRQIPTEPSLNRGGTPTCCVPRIEVTGPDTIRYGSPYDPHNGGLPNQYQVLPYNSKGQVDGAAVPSWSTSRPDVMTMLVLKTAWYNYGVPVASGVPTPVWVTVSWTYKGTTYKDSTLTIVAP